MSTCPLNVVNRYAFNSIDVLIGYFPTIYPIEGCHYPLKDVGAERSKRRSLLETWGRPGYKDLEGFRDSCIVREPIVRLA